MTESHPRVYGGATTVDRKAARRGRLLSATIDLLATEGWRALNVEAVSRVAGLNKRYFYESFASVDELGAALVGQIEDEILAATDIGRVREHSHPQTSVQSFPSAQVAIGALIDYLASEPRRTRAVFIGLAGSPEANRLRINLIQGIAERVARRAHDYHHIDEDRPIAQLAAALLIGGTIEGFLAWLDGRIDLTVAELTDALAGFWALVGDHAVAMPVAPVSPGRDA